VRKTKKDAHFFLIISNKLPMTCFEQIIVHHQEVCRSSLQYFTIHLYEESSRWHDTIETHEDAW